MTYTKLPITKIQISEANPRKAFDEVSILGLAQSIKTDGLLQNLIVGKAKGKKKLHPIICGERRFRAISHLVENGDLPKDYEVMCFLQLTFAGIPARVGRCNSLSMESFDASWTPATLAFYRQHGRLF